VIGKLPSLFKPEMVYDLADADISHLVAESETAAEERNRYTEKLGILTSGLQDLKRLDKHRSTISGMIITPPYYLFPTTNKLIICLIEGDDENLEEETEDGEDTSTHEITPPISIANSAPTPMNDEVVNAPDVAEEDSSWDSLINAGKKKGKKSKKFTMEDL
jgi:hypothetical protein